ncbi:MAG TPA: hypothetical protein PK770_06200 [Kiritimatiellia bacterium]|mgnify:CR=1 FL=1|jgi:hypothetical protein|nr:hypothetical protein [Kiritimatiellia bacterium]HOM59436.1 hypothetical protein [Kiritimatiellia bacterium]HOR98487.1 hypothetical protein [Kiritimatiellia bacterium]HPK37266.1 hypothetical protein [Kiritimatiellia bacterium]HPW74642.1 hypothetical protein [Kiritimatiellia bacterium]
MKRLGEPLFARDETGRLKTRIGTFFLRTPGLVTLPGVHATQRIAWLNELNRERQVAGIPALSEAESDAEIACSVDLLFNDQHVLIRPDPYAVDLAFEADEALQALVSKRKIRFLNTQNEIIRNALRARGENWRMSRVPVSPEEMNRMIAQARVAISGLPLYFHNAATGTRFLTLETFAWLGTQPDDVFRKHLAEIVRYSSLRNRFGYPEIDIFPVGCAFSRQAFEALNAEGLEIGALRAAYRKLLAAFREAVPIEFHEETFENLDWRNRLCSTLIHQPNAVATQDLPDGMAPEFHLQIEWLPGCRIDEGELIFDPVYEELDLMPEDAELRAFCDPRAREIIFNYVREFTTIEFINVGRITRSLSRRVQTGEHRTDVYVVQIKETGKPKPELCILRFQKWGVCEHLDEGKDMVRSIMEAVDYTDYVLDRRLGCRQLGMNLPEKVSTGRMPTLYTGSNSLYKGAKCWTVYFERQYIPGQVTDKILTRHYANPEFNLLLARLLGEAAVVNCVVGRANTEGQVLFDDGDEVITLDQAGMPERLTVSDHTGAFTLYEEPLEQMAEAYADPVNKRIALMPNPEAFAETYLASFRQRFVTLQQEYRRRRHAFDKLFKHRPVDPAGSLAYRWQCILARLDATDAETLTEAIRSQIRGLHP